MDYGTLVGAAYDVTVYMHTLSPCDDFEGTMIYYGTTIILYFRGCPAKRS